MDKLDSTFIKDEDGKEVFVGLDHKSNQVDYLEMYREGRLPELTEEKMICELQLLAMGNFFPLDLKVNTGQFLDEIEPYKNDWIDYLPRKNRPNNRTGLCLVGMKGDSFKDGLSIPEARYRHKRELFETDFDEPTELYQQLPSLHEFLDTFMPLGRTFLVKSNESGWFPPHRDGKWLGRDSFRLIAFLNNSRANQYNWVLDNQMLNIEEGRVYYVNTRLPHHTFSMTNDSIHLIVNVKMCLDNVLKLLTYA